MLKRALGFHHRPFLLSSPSTTPTRRHHHDVIPTATVDLVLRLARLGLDRSLTSLFSTLLPAPLPVLLRLFRDLAARSRGPAVPRAFSALLKAYSGARMPFEAVSAFLALATHGFLPSLHSCNFLMRFLADLGDSQAVRRVLDHAKALGIAPNRHTYAILIRSLCGCGDFEAAFAALGDASDQRVDLDGFVYATLVQGLCSAGSVDRGHEVLRFVRSAGVAMNAFAYGCVIAALCREGRLEEASRALEDMERHEVTPDTYAFGCVIRGYCDVGHIFMVLELHDAMVSKGIRTNCSIISSVLRCLSRFGMPREALEFFQRFRDPSSRIFIDEVVFHVAMDALCKLGNMREAVLLFHEMRERQLVPDAYHYTTLIDGYCRKEELHNAWKVLGGMTKQGVEPDVYTYNALAGGLSRNGCVQETFDVLHCMVICGSQKPNSKTYGIVIEGFCRGGNLKEAELLFRKIMEMGDAELDVTASAMVSGYLVLDCIDDAYKLFRRMHKRGILVDDIARSALLYKLCKAGKVRRAYSIYEIMSSMDLDLNLISCNNLISSLCRLAKLTETRRAHSLLSDILNKGLIIPNVFIYTTLMHGYSRINCLEEACELFLGMRREGIEPDIVAYTVLLDARFKCFGKNEKERAVFESSGLFAEVARVIRQMEALEIKSDVVCYTVLIDGHLKRHRELDALALFNEMKNVGLTPDVVTYTSLLSFYSRHREIERVKDLVHEMHIRGVVPDKVFAMFINEKVRCNYLT